VDERRQKCELLRRFQPPPEQLVLGSSRVSRFEPEYLQRRTALRTFNASVPNAAPIDCLALYRYAAEALRAPLRSVLIGVDTRAFFGPNRSDRDLAANAALRSFLPPSRRAAATGGEIPLLLSWAQSKDAWAALLHASRGGRRSRRRQLEADGYQRWTAQDDERSRRGWKLPATIDAQMTGDYISPARHEPNPYAAADLEALLHLLRARRIAATVIITPELDPVRQYWRYTGFHEREAAVREAIQQMAARSRANFSDFSDIRAFAGDPQEFYDGVHPTVGNTRRMIDTLVRLMQCGLGARSSGGE